ncbi:hypothetical protein [Bradyrhizobium sp. Arg816]|uniref:hypothetical protein n=1 Tax=Bradyrhizobium sp. Arg816 TaxID=2998491 RepID=UPI00249ED4FE|nr:hypothetical protein [Bradyrhizobium sp. Arg816]MDI3564779.1 hypothetical protein [Bradyrhizobium sp. Arg816]
MATNLALASIKATGSPTTRTLGDRFADVFNVKDYGAKVDGKTVTDLGATNGSANVTSSSFTAADVGKVINAYIGTSVTTTGNTASGSRVITGLASTTGIAPLQSVVGTNVPAGAYVVAVDTTNARVFFNQEVEASGTGNVSLTFINQVPTSILSAGAGTATLNVAASTTVTATRAYYGTDDSAAIGAAVVAAGTNGGGLVVLGNGTSMITTQINPVAYNSGNWPSNVSLTGQSRSASVLRWASPNSMADTAGNRAVIYSIHGAHSAALHDCNFEKFAIDMGAAIDSPYNYNGTAMRLVMNRNVTIRDVKFVGTPATCLGVDNPQRLLITGCLFENCARLGVTGGGSIALLLNENVRDPESFIVSNNQIFNSGCFGVMWENFFTTSANPTISDDNAIVIGNYIYYDAFQPNNTMVYGIQDAGGWGSQIIGNVIKGPSANTTQFVGIGMAAGDKTTFNTGGGQTLRIADNTVIGMGTPIYLLTAGSKDIIVDGNFVTQGGRSTTGGIAINNNADGTSRAMNNVNIRNNVCFGNAGAGICSTLGPATANTNWTIQNNTCFNNGTVGGNRAGILFATPQTGAIISGNRCYDNGTGMQQFGLQIASGVAVTGALVADNDFTGNASAGVSALGTITGIFQGNKGMPAPSISGNGTTPTGNGDIGTYTSNVTGTCTVVVTPFGTSNIIAENGYVGSAFDKTTPANAHLQTAYTTTSATFSGSTTTGDVIAFNLRMF